MGETSSHCTKFSSTTQPQGTSLRKGPIGKVAWGQERQAASGKRFFSLTVGHLCNSESKLVCFILTIEKTHPCFGNDTLHKNTFAVGERGSSGPPRRKCFIPEFFKKICYFPVWVCLILWIAMSKVVCNVILVFKFEAHFPFLGKGQRTHKGLFYKVNNFILTPPHLLTCAPGCMFREL